MLRTPLDEASQRIYTQLDILDAFDRADRALQISDTPFTAGLAYGHDLSQYAAPMLLPHVVKDFLRQNDQQLSTAEIRSTADAKRLASLTLGLSSRTSLHIGVEDGAADAPVNHINRLGRVSEIGKVTLGELGKFISGIPLPPETRRKLAFMHDGPDSPFKEVVTSLWLTAAPALEDKADYVSLERIYPLGLEEPDEDFLSTIHSGILTTELRPNGVHYRLSLKSERQLEDRTQITSVRVSAQIKRDPDTKKTKKPVMTIDGTTRTIVPGDENLPAVACNKDSVAEFVIAFLRKAPPAIPEVELVFQRGLPDVPDEAPGVDEL